MVVQVNLSVYRECDEGGELINLLVEVFAQLFLAKNITQKINCKHFHDFRISLCLGPEELVSNFCQAVEPKNSVRNEYVRLRVNVLLTVLGEHRFHEHWLNCFAIAFTEQLLFWLIMCNNSDISQFGFNFLMIVGLVCYTRFELLQIIICDCIQFTLLKIILTITIFANKLFIILLRVFLRLFDYWLTSLKLILQKLWLLLIVFSPISICVCFLLFSGV
jgi:hypothetical protein